MIDSNRQKTSREQRESRYLLIQNPAGYAVSVLPKFPPPPSQPTRPKCQLRSLGRGTLVRRDVQTVRLASFCAKGAMTWGQPCGPEMQMRSNYSGCGVGLQLSMASTPGEDSSRCLLACCNLISEHAAVARVPGGWVKLALR